MQQNVSKMEQTNEIRFADIFAGVGGIRLGLEQADPRFRCVYSCEFDKHARAVYNHRFGERGTPQDIRAVNTADIPDIDLLCGGFPCPSFSQAGDRRGLEDPRGQLFFELCRILWDKKPQRYLFENVDNLLYHDHGRTLQKITAILWELGYTVEWQILNTRDFGVPQNRERVFLTGNLRGECRSPILPIRSSERVYFTTDWGGKEEREWFWGADYSSTITRNYRKGVHAGGEPYVLLNNVLLPEDYDVFYIDSETYEVYKGEPRNDYDERIVICPYCGVEHGSYGPAGECTCLGIHSPFELEDHDEVRLRRLTPLECERLQGFPDNWTAEGVMDGKVVPISDSQRYSQMGNAVSVPVIRAIGERLAGAMT
jgi:DNA (cytosine-5)-methyltransferase 1